MKAVRLKGLVTATRGLSRNKLQANDKVVSFFSNSQSSVSAPRVLTAGVKARC